MKTSFHYILRFMTIPVHHTFKEDGATFLSQILEFEIIFLVLVSHTNPFWDICLIIISHIAFVSYSFIWDICFVFSNITVHFHFLSARCDSEVQWQDVLYIDLLFDNQLKWQWWAAIYLGWSKTFILMKCDFMKELPLIFSRTEPGHYW